MSNQSLLLGYCILVTAGAAFPASSAQAQRDPAREYPSKPIRFVVPATAGGAGDIFARTVGYALAEKFGKQVVIDNRPGANGIIGEIVGTPPGPFAELIKDELGRYAKLVKSVGLRVE